jgi:23S rRNA (uracil1939-C5)-methyltransferase
MTRPSIDRAHRPAAWTRFGVTDVECRHHPTCPGCPLARTPYDEQLTRKRARLARALSRFEHLPAPAEMVGSAWTEAYRHRLKLPVHHGGRVSMGLYAEDGRVLHTPDCPVLADGLRKAIPAILDWLQGRRSVHSVDLRVSEKTGEIQAIFACRGADLDGGAKAAHELMSRAPGVVSVSVSRADPEGKRVMGSEPRVIAGKETIDEAIGDVGYDLLPGSFFQVDPRQAMTLQRLVREAVGSAQTVLDLYAGVGAYALMLAPGRKRVVAVEEVPQAAEAARRRAPPNVEVITSRVEDADLKGHFDVAILNPARRGSDPDSLARLAKMASKLVYVSCGPETLARDLDVLSAYGLRVDKVVGVDLFPQTPEVEAVVTLSRGKARTTWPVAGGTAQSPWTGNPSGAVGRPQEVMALLVGTVAEKARVPGARIEVVGRVATHSLVRLRLDGPLGGALRLLGQRGHRVVGQDKATQRFFREKAGLQRPFLHVTQADGARVALHGDLVLALEALGVPPDVAETAHDAPPLAAAPRRGRPGRPPGRPSGRPGRRR